MALLCLIFCAGFIFSVVKLCISFAADVKIEIKHEYMNSECLKNLKNKGFKAKRVYYVNDNYSVDKQRKMVVCDIENNKTCFIDYEKSKAIICDNDEINNCEISEIVTNKMDGVNVGWGKSHTFSSFSGTESQKIESLKLIIKFKSLEKPQLIYDITEKKTFSSLYKNSAKYSDIISTVQQVKSYIEAINSQNTVVTNKPLKFIYCKFCGSKNDANNTKCDSCGSTL